MASYLDEQDIYPLYEQAKTESYLWRKDYQEFERLADNELIADLDESLPEVNDGSLAASLFKLPKRIVNTKLKGRATATNRDDKWLTELANMQWENEIIPNANSQAPYIRKWKDAVRKAAIYGSVPIITLFVNRGEYTGSDFIVGQPQDVTLEPGKVSDNDSDVMFWDVYYTKLQLKEMIAQAKAETAENEKADEEGYNKWDIPALEKILAGDMKDERPTQDEPQQKQDKSVDKSGFHFCVIFQRGVGAPFYMYHKETKANVREWSNPDPTGDLPIHFLYCYQDFINPYGIGIVKLAGGTQNVLDYMRQSDVLSTMLGLRPPISIGGDTSETDLDSIIYAQDQQWILGNATVKREELNNQIYAQIPNRISMYKTSLNQLIPTGDTSISSESGDPQYSKTPAGVKFQGAQLSIDDEDFKDNLNITYAVVAKSMINTHFANMQGEDLMKLSEEERKILEEAGIQFPVGEDGEPSNELEITWDEVRASFDFEVDAEQDKAKDDEKRLEGLLKVAQFKASDPMFDQALAQDGKKLNTGELYSEIISLTSNNDKIIEDIPESEQSEDQMQPQIDPETGQPIDPNAQQEDPVTPDHMIKGEDMLHRQEMDKAKLALESRKLDQTDAKMAQDMQLKAQEGKEKPGGKKESKEPTEDEVNLQAVMEQYGVDEGTAMAMLEAEKQGFNPQEIVEALKRNQPIGAVNG